MAKTVCIIGAGPSGLVAAKTLTHDHKGAFHVTVFEQSHRIGGLWPVSNVDDGMVNPDMCTNQSRHTVSFSDLAWPETAPAFPKAWQVGQYLERYIKTYPGHQIRLNTRVTEANLDGNKWKVRVQQTSKDAVETYDFDHLIISTGFFGKPRIPQELSGLKIPVWHTSKIRKVEDLLINTGSAEALPGENIVVLGNAMSAIETAASIAFQISSATSSAEQNKLLDAEKYTVCHILSKPVWVLPLFFPTDPKIEKPALGQDAPVKLTNSSPSILPIDLVMYNLANRPLGPLQNISGHITPEAAQFTHNLMETYVGTDQGEFGTNFAIKECVIRQEPALLAASDQYLEFVRQGKIKVLDGRLQVPTNQEPLYINVENIAGESTPISDVAAFVCGTGFDPSPSVSFLPEGLLTALQFDPSNDAFPLALNVHSTINKLVPSLGFVGFYRAPYWGVMEMQARFLAKLWSNDAKAVDALDKDTTIDTLLKLRDDPRRSQFPMGDYSYLMESFSEILGIKRIEPENSATPDSRTGPVLPSRYIYNASDPKQKAESATAIRIVEQLLVDSRTKGKFVARAVFRGMQGIWHLERRIVSKIDSFPSGTLHGTASLLPRFPTNKDVDMEYLYFEEGEFKTTWGGAMSAKRSYVYHYRESSDKMDVWFAKPDYKTSDYFFHQLEFAIPDENDEKRDGQGWKASSSHLCIDDLYNVAYEFKFNGASLESWISKYIVKGPHKDYIIENTYIRPV